MVSWQMKAESIVRNALVDKVDRDHHETDRAFLRRRIIVAVVLVVGATLLGVSLSTEPGDPMFYTLTIALALVWIVGGFLSGPLHLGRINFRGTLRRPIITPIAIGLAAGGVFILGALVVREIPPLRDFTANVLDHARVGPLALIVFITLFNGVAEEIFFRGALFSAIGVKRPVVISTVVYTIATLATGNPMLGFAAITLGFVLGLERRASGGILAPILTHVAWSTVMVFAMPPLFA
ncbi:CPBP family intramembrane metalloprotease [Rhodococcus sp. BP-349]|uniref:CPBP family intramembrane glutamic endopeptidase n=1 Tax=unclassified Rhodococcus (in: high G+C Gram-positive bacteria) TaxID=192944 RepID=UPI001C9AEAA8|nr:MULTISPECIES: type II CAAX endopeptidase family protein [unclassified Rhodococcus (in: high G+C Gram-positive bacteria)]MBY6538866.1 CPBP family intramembrane metalloprotease [Rhodococcus sp. BP-363]MBY6543203.1 CPBP family intramembrane metalloprotease [Rhodococcus sp. BP-369]MBY6562433.1 CPBP family intramembrane metalloprotease [Rhodococcus sp. BP-370]MBY6576725.1 CPBP family intramembrane metalloprotease [Rhodococcus sp. BP-364]MBY6586026.1 CPBP family intramembrane metalloprotease [Rho